MKKIERSATSTNKVPIITNTKPSADGRITVKCKDFDFSELYFGLGVWEGMMKDFRVGDRVRVTVTLTKEVKE